LNGIIVFNKRDYTNKKSIDDTAMHKVRESEPKIRRAWRSGNWFPYLHALFDKTAI